MRRAGGETSILTGWTAARVGIALLAFVVLGVAACGQPGVSDVQAFRGARLIDGDGTVLAERGVVIVRDGRIVVVGDEVDTPVPDGARVTDLPSRTMMPGFVNAHGHVADTQGLESGPEHYTESNLLRQLRQYADYGVTTVVSLGGDGDAGFALRDGSVGPLDRARVFVAGPVITAATPEDARREVRDLAARRPDFVKFRVDDNLGSTQKMPIEVAGAIIDEAHAQGLRAAAHIFYLEDAKALLRAGIDLIAHSIRDQPVDDELVTLLRERDICVSPTLTRELSTFVYERGPSFFGDSTRRRWASPARTPNISSMPESVWRSAPTPDRPRAFRVTSSTSRWS
jgi:hypothetical protein